MNNQSQEEPNAIVQQAVQPIRATIIRMQTMREELLAHLVGDFD